MILVLLPALLLGILAGTITGLVPGVHINLIAVLLVGFSGFFLKFFQPIALIVFIVSMAITHTFIDFLPSIFLGAPDEDTFLSILPGHEMLNKGQAYEAVILTLIGSFSAIILFLALIPAFFYLLPIAYPYIRNITPFILLTASFFLIYLEKSSKINALIIFILAGFLGIASLNQYIQQPMLPLLTGLFGASSLITSVMKKQKIPKQKIFPIINIKRIIKIKSLFRALIASVLSSPLCCFLPGLGSGQAAVIGSEIIGDKKGIDRKEFLILLGSINTLIISLSFITLYSIQKTRTGAALAVQQLISNLSAQDLLIIVIAIIVSGICAFFLTIFLAKVFSKNITKIKYQKTSIIVLISLSIIVLFFSGLVGFIIFITSTALGLFCIFLGVRRIHLMGALLIPVILFYLSF